MLLSCSLLAAATASCYKGNVSAVAGSFEPGGVAYPDAKKKRKCCWNNDLDVEIAFRRMELETGLVSAASLMCRVSPEERLSKKVNV